MVKARPEVFYAFVGTGQLAAEFSRSSAVAYPTLLERASRQGNLQPVQELKDVGPPNDGKGFVSTQVGDAI